jgi:hypothetical protein
MKAYDKGLSAEPEDLAKAIGEKPKKVNRNLIAQWKRARARKEAKEKLVEERYQNAKLAASYNDCLAQARTLRAEKLSLNPDAVGGWRAWGLQASGLETAARELDVRANNVRAYFEASIIRIQDLEKAAGVQVGGPHENLRRRLAEDARVSAAALQKLLDAEKASEKQQAELEVIESPADL